MDKKTAAMYLLLSLVFVVFFFKFGTIIAYDTSYVDTQVNITNALPIVRNITINYGSAINLTQGSNTPVLCNVTVTDYRGKDNIVQVNATMFRTNVTEVGNQDNTSRYFVTNCTYLSTPESWTYAYNCSFNITYYAFNGTWNCTVWVNNTLNSPVNATNSSYILPLYAINVTDNMSFGSLAVFDTSSVRYVNVTNFGNMPINLTVYGYGGDTNTTGGGLSFMCPNSHGTNISIGVERWSLLGDVAWDTMMPLSSGPILQDNLTIYKQKTDVMIYNVTYWKLYVPPNPFGLCNGTIVYEAIAAE